MKDEDFEDTEQLHYDDFFHIRSSSAEVAKHPDLDFEFIDSSLFVDIDTEPQYRDFKRRLKALREATTLPLECSVSPSKSGLPHRHALIRLPKSSHFTVLERIALQAVLGGDMNKEFCSVIRVFAGDEHPIMRFMKRQVSTKVL